jgi:hypothetical protein
LFLVLPFSQLGLTFFRLEKQAARRGGYDTVTGLAPSKELTHAQGYPRA